MSRMKWPGRVESSDANASRCEDCGAGYGTEEYVECIVTADEWAALADRPDGGGLLCHRCMCRRARERGLAIVAVVARVERLE